MAADPSRSRPADEGPKVPCLPGERDDNENQRQPRSHWRNQETHARHPVNIVVGVDGSDSSR